MDLEKCSLNKTEHYLKKTGLAGARKCSRSVKERGAEKDEVLQHVGVQ